jgi:hypothetical protein
LTRIDASWFSDVSIRPSAPCASRDEVSVSLADIRQYVLQRYRLVLLSILSTERYASGAAGSRSGAEAIRRRLHALVRPRTSCGVAG